MLKLTETFARKTPQSIDGTKKHWDSELRGLVLFVGKQSKTWYFQKDVGGYTKRVLIGRYPTITAASARQTALGLALEMSRGAGRAVQAGAPTLGEALEVYLARPKLRSEAHKNDIRGQFRLQLRDWLKLPLTEISKAMVVARHRKMADVPSSANHAFRRFRAVWNHARRTHDLPESPTMAIEWYEERPNGTIIKDLTKWKSAVDQLYNPIHAVFYRFLLFTGFRKTEALTLRWRDVHDDRIHLPMTKNGRSFDLPIIDKHHEILEPLRKLSREWVFPSPKSPKGYLTSPEKLPWSPHAHRRTFATVAMEAGVLEEVVGRLLNHTPLSITGQRYTLPSLDALRPAKHIARLYAVEKQARGQPPDQRVRLRQAHSRPILDDLDAWLHVQLPNISSKSELAKAIRYALTRMKKLRPYLDHGVLEADNNCAERAMKPIALGRKNFLFVGSEGGGKSATIS